MMNIDTFTFNLFEEKTYVVSAGGNRCAIIDPGCCSEAEGQELLGALDRKGMTPEAILLTHGHLDHIYGAAFLQSRFGGIPVYLNTRDIPVMEGVRDMARKFGMQAPDTSFSITDISEGGTVRAAGLAFEVIATPGHTPGGVCYLEREEGCVFTGDTLFAGAIGRTDLPCGEYDDEIRSIMEKIILLDPETRVLPGHGPSTTIGRERNGNPFLEPFNEEEEIPDPDAEPIVIHGSR